MNEVLELPFWPVFYMPPLLGVALPLTMITLELTASSIELSL